MFYDPKIHRRRSIRLKEYDYSQCGYYFVTVCTQNRKLLFENDCVIEMIGKWWNKLPTKFPNVEIDEFVVMPNHVHGIIVIVVGADPRVCPMGEHMGSPVHRIIQWFKTMTTNEYIRNVHKFGWIRFDKKLWQRNYYEHIIRYENELFNIRRYIQNNPLEWYLDQNIVNNLW